VKFPNQQTGQSPANVTGREEFLVGKEHLDARKGDPPWEGGGSKNSRENTVDQNIPSSKVRGAWVWPDKRTYTAKKRKEGC